MRIVVNRLRLFERAEPCSNESIVGRNDRMDVKNGSGTHERPALHSHAGAWEREQMHHIVVPRINHDYIFIYLNGITFL